MVWASSAGCSPALLLRTAGGAPRAKRRRDVHAAPATSVPRTWMPASSISYLITELPLLMLKASAIVVGGVSLERQVEEEEVRTSAHRDLRSRVTSSEVTTSAARVEYVNV